MKRTVELDEELVEEATKAAIAHGRTLTALVEDALREKLDDLLFDAPEQIAKTKPEPKTRIVLPVFHGDGPQAGVNLDSWAELVDFMDREDGSPGR